MPAVRDKLLVIAPLAQTFLTVPHPLLCRPGASVTETGIFRNRLVAALQHRCPTGCVLVRWPFSDTSRARWQITRAHKPEARRSRLWVRVDRVFSFSLQHSLGTVVQTMFFTLQHLDMLHVSNVWCFHLHTPSTTVKRDCLTLGVLYLCARDVNMARMTITRYIHCRRGVQDFSNLNKYSMFNSV